MSRVRVLQLLLLTLLASLGGGAAAAEPGLVAYWTFDEAQGNVALDLSGKGNTGTVQGAKRVPGLVGGALDFDGATSRVRVRSAASLNPGAAFSVEAWVNLRSNSGPRVIVSKWDDVNQRWSYIFKKHNSADGLRIELSKQVHNDLVDLGGASPLPLGRWTHVAATYDAATGAARLYVNGALDASAQLGAPSAPIKASAADLLIGAVNPGRESEFFDGLLDEVKLWNRALSPREVAAHAGALLALFEAPTFQDGFDGGAVDPARWNVANATGGARWCSSTVEAHQSNPGVWQDVATTPCQGVTSASPVYGAIAVGNGLASFTGSDDRTFPWIVRGPGSLGSPFPPAGDFFLETRLRYDAIFGNGTGLVVERWDDTTPSGDNPPVPSSGGLLSIWDDAATFSPRVSLGTGIIFGGTPIPGDPTGFHTYRLDLTGGTYTASADGVPMPQVPATFRPNAIWLGNPVFTWWGQGPWTSFTMDSLRVVAIPVRVPVDVWPGLLPNVVRPATSGLLGLVAVAVFGSAALDVAQIDPATVTLSGAPVALHDGKPVTATLDLNGDGLPDLLALVEGWKIALPPGDGIALLSARTLDGRFVRGADSIRVLP